MRIKAYTESVSKATDYCFQIMDDTKDLGRKSTRGSLISIATQAVKFINQVITVSILAHILTLEDFGFITMAKALINLLKIFTG